MCSPLHLASHLAGEARAGRRAAAASAALGTHAHRPLAAVGCADALSTAGARNVAAVVRGSRPVGGKRPSSIPNAARSYTLVGCSDRGYCIVPRVTQAAIYCRQFRFAQWHRRRHAVRSPSARSATSARDSATSARDSATSAQDSAHIGPGLGPHRPGTRPTSARDSATSARDSATSGRGARQSGPRSTATVLRYSRTSRRHVSCGSGMWSLGYADCTTLSCP